MKGLIRRTASSVAVIALTFSPVLASAATPDHVRGRILLQVESRGEAWYVSPVTGERSYLRDGAAAYALLRADGLGISNAELAKIPVGIDDRFSDTDGDGDGLADKLEESLGTNPGDSDSDDDGFSDGTEIRNGYDPLRGNGERLVFDAALTLRLSGRILLQVESRGEAWYVHPVEKKRYYMKDGAAFYAIMRLLSLGISNADLAGIPIAAGSAALPEPDAAPATGTTQQDCGQDLACFHAALAAGTPATVVNLQVMPLFFLPGTVVFHSRITSAVSRGEWSASFKTVGVERFGEAHRGLFVGLATDEEINMALAQNTREGMIAAGYPAEQIDAFFTQEFLDTILSSSASVSTNCSHVDRVAFSTILEKWGRQEFSFSSSSDEDTLGGDYTFGSCTATVPQPVS